jgi:cell division protein FtsL
MKKNSTVKKFVYAIVVVLTVLFLQLWFTAKIRELGKKAEILNAKLAREQDVLASKLVELQKLSSEENIVKRAEKLGLVRSPKPFEKIFVNENRIKRLEKLVNSKYE